ncbi:nitrilase [Azoarcus indigens]|uniref:Nitrilase n=1 Tax=Azoarcus indigens TaxID=29545 RepID=A0A4R6DSS3_9RHOO|nr:carbon-nitrogen hydrolase family protein [Azoarcus indigens]NMG67031.1 nitrilase [Azoarcus indigens]TDN48181.1 nitrilase [Azoarcus indigens]
MQIKAAVVQAGAIPFDLEASLTKAERLIAEAGRQACELVVFPEAYLSAYPKGQDYGVSIGVRTPEGREEFRRYFDSSVQVPGPVTERLGKAAAQAGLHLVMGVIERDFGTLYCTVLFFGPDGGLLGKHRKLMPTAAERLVWGFGDGSTLPVYDTAIGNLGAVICWENYMPMLRMAMYGKKINLYCAPTADDRESWLPTMRHIALEGRCFVLTSCQVLRRGDFPEDYVCQIDGTPETLLMRGGSAIIDPLGRVLAGPLFDEEGILTATLDMGEITRGKLDFDVAGHYARPDVFQLTVNEAPQQPVNYVRPARG